MIEIRPGLYKHYKGGLYIVEGIARHTERTAEDLVIYTSLDTHRLWARPASMWNDRVDGKPRFELIAEMSIEKTTKLVEHNAARREV